MMETTQPDSVLHLARLVLETATPLSIGTGHPDGVFDTALVRDANGLPAIPGTSLAGVLRHLWTDLHGEAEAEELFGFQKGEAGASSRVRISWGALLDSRGRPAEGLLMGEEGKRLDDELYAAVIDQADNPVLRDRVRLTHRGAAAHEGKFDRSVLPAGHRFAVEVRLWSADEDDPRWDKLLALFAHPLLRLGGGTRAGLGAMRLVSCHRRSFQLAGGRDAQALTQLGPGLADTDGLASYRPRPSASADILHGALILQARGPWRIGQGNVSLRPSEPKVADLLPKTEECVTWEDGRGRRRLRQCLFPASSLKGALAHRMDFHDRRFRGEWAEENPVEDTRTATVEALLGAVKDQDGGRAGALYLDDAWAAVDPDHVGRLVHNAIDRFTGGVRNRVLFEEETLHGGEIRVPVTLHLGRIPADHREAVRRALKAALDDLCQGRLALGSRITIGNGVFQGRLEGELGRWLEGTETTQEAAA